MEGWEQRSAAFAWCQSRPFCVSVMTLPVGRPQVGQPGEELTGEEPPAHGRAAFLKGKLLLQQCLSHHKGNLV